MVAAQLTGSFFGSRVGLTPRSTPARAKICCTPRAEKAANAGTWLPGIDAPQWLEQADYPGNRGFDVLNFGTDKNRLEWYVEAEKYNGRWAMAGAVGILGQELLGVQPVWFEAGTKDYGFPIFPLTAIEFLIFGAVELKRYRGWKEHKTSGAWNWFPFDPLKLYSETNQIKEIKNGRLAMLAFVGFITQASVTRQGPVQNLKDHLADPFGKNFITSLANIQNVVGGPSVPDVAQAASSAASSVS